MADLFFWRQCFILGTGILNSFCTGFLLAYPAVLTPSLLSNDTDIKATREQASWIVASNGIAGMFGSFILGPIIAILGRKAVHISINALLLIGWIIFCFAEDIYSLFAARLVQGLVLGGIYIHSIIISEYVHPSRRGYFITIKKVMIAVGNLCCHASGFFWTWRQIALIPIVPQVFSIFLTLFWPESPSYLALNGRFDECKKSFRWLNGCSEESKKHLNELIEAQMQNANNQKWSFKQLLRKFLEKDFQKPLLIISVLTLAVDLCGRYYFVAYVTEIMMKLLDNKTSATYFTIGADLLTVIAMACSTFVVKALKRRTILYVFGSFSVLLMFTISLLAYLSTIFLNSSGLLWLTALIITFLCFVVNIGFVPVSFALAGEIFPLEHIGLGVCCSGFIFMFLYTLTLKLTPVLMFHTGIYGIYAIYGFLMALCLGLTHKILPETKDKTLLEIEYDMKGLKKIMNPLIPKA